MTKTLEISRNATRNGDVLPLKRFTQMLAKEVGAKEASGAIRLSFQGYAQSGEKMWDNKDIRKFVAKMFARVPGILYYLDPRYAYDILACIAQVVENKMVDSISPYQDVDNEPKTTLYFDDNQFNMILHNVMEYAKEVEDEAGGVSITEYYRMRYPLRKGDLGRAETMKDLPKSIEVAFTELEADLLASILRDALGRHGDILLPSKETPDIRKLAKGTLESILKKVGIAQYMM